MEEIKGLSITKEKKGYTEENMMFTYSDEEMEQNIINTENAKAVFSPEFIPFYREIQKQFNLSDKQTLVYGFIRFYKATCSTRFYFTDVQLGEVIGCNDKTAQKAISTLKKLGLIKVGHKIRSGGGTTRFVKQVALPVGSEGVSTVPTQGVCNNNKIKENKINISYKDSYKNFLQGFNSIVSSSYKGSDKVYKQFEARLKEGYTLKDIAIAIRNASGDEYLMGKNEGNKRYLTPEYILRSNKLDQWLNATPTKKTGMQLTS